MNQIPHTTNAPSSNRPNPGQVLKQAIAREDTRKRERRDAVMAAASHAFIFVLVVLGTIAVAIN